MISSRNECVFIHDLSNLSLKIIVDAGWASMNVAYKHSIAWNNSRHAPVQRFYLPSGIEETGSRGIICIISHPVLCHPSDHGTTSMWKYFLAKAHIPKLYKLPELEVTELTTSKVDERALAILKRQGSWESIIASSRTKFILDIQVIYIITELTGITLHTGSYGLCNCRISPRHL